MRVSRHRGRLSASAVTMAWMLWCTVAATHIVADHIVADEEHFQQKVAPILVKRCLSCHNNIDRKGDISVQNASGAQEIVAPGDPDNSLLLEAIGGDEPSMPKDGERLSRQDVNAIRQWIRDGGNWPSGLDLRDLPAADFDWWSLRPLSRPKIPDVDRSADWARNPIDAFIAAKHAELGLNAAPPADRRTLIRRLTYDLTGLPPTPEEVASFLADQDPNAYERLVDRLLESKHYGERWGRHWLDVVKYADTCGYDKDKLRPNAWPYRDYVIRSFNEDKPYGRFVKEQLAGDILYPNSPDGVLALGFIAAGPWDFIGHVEVPESKQDGMVARHLDRDEMVSNTLNTFCSTTIQCARCHNHKFDPFTQEHYYSLQAIFAAVDRAERPYDIDEGLQSQRLDLARQKQEITADLAAIQKQIEDEGGETLKTLSAEVERLRPLVGPKGKRPEFGYHSQVAPRADIEKWVQVDLGAEVSVRHVKLHPCHDDFANIGAGFGFPARFTVEVSRDGTNWTTALDRTGEDFPNPGLTPVVADVSSERVRYVRVVATKLAPRAGVYIMALAELAALDPQGKNLALGAEVTSLDSIEAPDRWRRSNLTDGIWAQAADATAQAQLAKASEQLEDLRSKLLTPERAARQKSLRERLATIEQQIEKLPVGNMVYAAATQFAPQGNFKPTGGKPRPVHVLHRGEITKKLERVQPGVLPLSANQPWRLATPAGNEPSNEEPWNEGQYRVALAEWITSKDNPLTWRSIVNRVWLYHFGQGIVASPNDFGRMGQRPSHPELLDWLAVEFRDGSQSLKELHRLIVTSETYRQASGYSATNAKLDSGNRYLWRMNRRRLHAEEIRDTVLTVSGALNPEMGGPGYYLFVLEKTAHSPHYEYHKFDPADKSTHRRSVYRFIVRSQPDPYMTTLDCADSSQSTPRRDETITALQALSLMNNRFHLTMAQRFADRLQRERDDLPSQIQRGFQLALSRSATPEELAPLVQHAQTHGLANTCRLLFNLSEFVYLD